MSYEDGTSRQQFVCVAEAVAHYGKCGFDTVEKVGDEARRMEHPDGHVVVITHPALLTVYAYEQHNI